MEEAGQADKISSEDQNTDFRVQVKSKKQVQEQIDRYKELLKTVLDGQTELAADTKKELLGELLANFEAAVQENVLVNGQTWNEAPEDEEEDDLESQLDDAERKLMGLYENTVHPQEVPKDPEQETIMNMLSAEAPSLAKQATHVIKSIQTLQKQAEGLCQILNMKPSAASLEIHREVFGDDEQSNDMNQPFRHRQPIKRLAEEASSANSYIPQEKKYHCEAGE
ncbi:hypothetical protein WMY93_015906 [Mugilogobius chulae]|uniref:NSL1 component of MIS12 kinetochore complex n=1 Tax=Mugilogobius chulae TaxID=88201 RepID=A0AAW0NRH4_9GOBI